MADERITTQAPWAPQQPFLEYGFGQARGLYDRGGPSYFPGDTVAQYGDTTQDAMQAYLDEARRGQVPGAATNQMQGTLSGAYLPNGGLGMGDPIASPGGSNYFNEQTGMYNYPGMKPQPDPIAGYGQGQAMGQSMGQSGNPYLDAMSDAAARQTTRQYSEAVAPGIQSQFANSGRSGSGLYANAMDSSRDTLGRNLSEANAGLYGGAYENERGRQMQALSMAPQIANLGYLPASMEMNVGNLEDIKSQENITADFQRHMFNQERPWDALGRYQSMIQGNYGNQTSKPIYNSGWGNIAGLGMGLLGAAQGNSGINDYLRRSFGLS